MLTLILLALALTGAGVAAGGDTSPKRPGPRRTTRTTAAKPQTAPVKHRDPSDAPPPDDTPPDPMQSSIWTSWAVTAPIEARVMDLPIGPEWSIEVIALAPDIEGGIRFPGESETYGYAAGPDGSAPAIEALLSTLTDAAEDAAPAAGAAAMSVGIPPGVVESAVGIATALIDKIPDAIGRARVRAWSRWREGSYGDAAERARVRSEVATWRDADWRKAIRKAWVCQYWRFAGSPTDAGEQEWALVADTYPEHTGGGKSLARLKPCANAAPPRVWSEGIGGGYARVFVRLEPSTLGVSERRYVVLARV